MYLIEKLTKDNKRFVEVATAKEPFGPSFDKQTVIICDVLEIWGSGITEFADDGAEDFCLFKLFRDGRLVGERKVMGY